MGRRWGKSVLGGCVSLAVASQGGRAAWIVPEYKNARPLWRFVESTVAPMRAAGLARMDRQERTVEFPNGGSLGIYTADNPDSIRGDWFSLVVLDEAAKIAEDAWTDAIEPTLADCDGDAMLISTPRGRNWFWREWMAASQDGDYAASWQAPTSDNPNPRILALMERMRTRAPERTFRQEWLAEFVQDGGGVFRRVLDAATATPQSERVKVTTDTLDGPADSWHQYVVGVDWGKHHDFTVLAVLDVTLGQLVSLDRFNQIDYALQTQRLKALCERFKPTVILAERNSMGEPLIEQLQRDNLPVQPFVTSNATKAEIVDGLALAFERGQLQILHDPVLLGELHAYEAQRLPSGLLRYSAPAGLHDDCVISLALAWHAASTEGVEYGPSLWD